MKMTLFFLLFFVLATHVDGQEDFSKADSFAGGLVYMSDDARELSGFLTSGFKSDIQKARVIYTWVCKNISYDINKSLNRTGIRYTYSSEEEKKQILEKIISDGVRETLKRRKGICEDYSNLFTALCRYSGLEVKTIRGSARVNPRLTGQTRLPDDHTWNAIKINASWWIVDATWGAGSIDPGRKKFIKSFREEFFMIDPSIAIFSHYPKDREEQLLPGTIGPEELAKMPVTGNGFVRYRVTGFEPSTAIIKSNREGTVVITITSGGKVPGKYLVTEDNSRKEIQPVSQAKGTLTFEISTKGRSGRLVTISGLEEGQVYDIITYKIQ
ncbi:MAG: transglutaminase domain-containing protein [Bacteroidales bacterium]